MRKKLREFGRHYARNPERQQAWFFGSVSVPDVVTIRARSSRPMSRICAGKMFQPIVEVLKREQQCWTFDPKAAWHGYAGYSAGYAMRIRTS